MMQSIQRWEVHIYFEVPDLMMIFFIYDNFYSNMLGKLKEIHFLHEPTSVEIKKSIMDNQTGVKE